MTPRQKLSARIRSATSLLVVGLLTFSPLATLAYGQTNTNDAPPILGAAQLDKLVAPIALYPDPLLSQTLAACSFPEQIPGAYAWANSNKNLKGDALVNAMSKGDLPYDPSVQALLPFPSVLELLNKNLDGTAQLGNAVLAQRAAVMDAVQRQRKIAYDYGNLKSNQQMKVTTTGSPQVIEIQSPDPQVIYVPVYSPTVVYAPAPVVAPPPPAGAAFFFGMFGFLTAVAITNAFRDSCWGYTCGFGWSSHTIIIHNTSWGRSWNNRGVYVHSWGGYNTGFYSRPNAYVNRPINVNVNNVNIQRNNNFRGNNNNININNNNNNRPGNNGPGNNNNRPGNNTGNRPGNSGPGNNNNNSRPNNNNNRPNNSTRQAVPVGTGNARPATRPSNTSSRPAPSNQNRAKKTPSKKSKGRG